MNKKSVLSIKNLNKSYSINSSKSPDSVHALKNLNLDVKEGEIFGLLGPNGAGKTTFINILSGTTIKTSGEVNVWGFDLDANPRQVRASIGIVPQEVNLDPFFSPRKLLELQAGMYGVKKTNFIYRFPYLQDEFKTIGNSWGSDNTDILGGMSGGFQQGAAKMLKQLTSITSPAVGIDFAKTFNYPSDGPSHNINFYLDNREELDNWNRGGGKEQTILNYHLVKNNITPKLLPPTWNLFSMHKKEMFQGNWQMTEDSTPFFIKYGNIWHYTGISLEDRVELMRITWETFGNKYV